MRQFIISFLAVVTVISGLALATPTVLAENDNVLQNGSFEKRIDFWEFWSFGCSVNSIRDYGYATTCDKDEPLRREINLYPDMGDKAPVKDNMQSLKVIIDGERHDIDWKSHIQTSLDPRYTFEINEGTMVVKFWAKASFPFMASVTLNDSFEPYESLGLYEKFELTNEWKLYSYMFEAKPSSSAALIVNLGDSEDYTIFGLDEVELYYVDQPKITDTEIISVSGEKVTLHIENISEDQDYSLMLPIHNTNSEDLEKTYTNIFIKEVINDTFTFILPFNARTGKMKIQGKDLESNEVMLKVEPTLVTYKLSHVYAIGDELTLDVKGVSPGKTETYVSFNGINSLGNAITFLKPVIFVSEQLDKIKVIIPAGAVRGDNLRIVKDISVDGEQIVLKSKTNLGLPITPQLNYADLNNGNLELIGRGFGGLNDSKFVRLYDNKGDFIVEKQIVEPNRFYDGNEHLLINIGSFEPREVNVRVGKFSSGKVLVTSDNVIHVPTANIEIKKIIREKKELNGEIKGVLYIVGENFGSYGAVKVADVWADIHYRRDDYIIAVIPVEKLYGQVIITKEYSSVKAIESPVVIEAKIKINKIVREEKTIKGEQKAVLSIYGENFGSEGGVKVGNSWVDIHYRRHDFIIAVVDLEEINGVVIVAKK